MLVPLYVSAIVAVLFYILLPGLAAWRAAMQWRSFRRDLATLYPSPLLDYAAFNTARTASGSGLPGLWRLDGRVEAMEGEDRLWLKSPSLSAVVDFSRSHVHVLARSEASMPFDAIERAGTIERLRWDRVRSLPEGSRIFVAGPVRNEGGHPLFHAGEAEPFLAVVHDEEEADLFRALVAGGRSRNELWSRSTFLIWALGLGILSLISAWAAQTRTIDSVRFMTWLIALSPILPFIPPGTVLIMLARAAWKGCLLGRMRRDLEAIPGAGSAEPAAKLNRPYAAAVFTFALVALAFVVNFVLTLVVWRLLS